MSDSTTLVDYEGAITFGTIEMLLNKLRDNATFNNAPKPVRKRLYGIFVESLDNIFKYAAPKPRAFNGQVPLPRISVHLENQVFRVETGNMVSDEIIGDLQFKLDRVNQLDMEGLKSLYEEVINKEVRSGDTGAGLGLITMAMRTCQDIEYAFKSVEEGYSYFNMRIFLHVNT